jgi:hypothetical protein
MAMATLPVEPTCTPETVTGEAVLEAESFQSTEEAVIEISDSL